MTTPRSSFFISGAVIALIIIAPLVALAAWSEPSQAPTGGNVDPPINTGSQNQIKNGGLSVTSFAVFGSTALNGNTYLKTGVTGSIYRYLNFGADYDVNGNVIASTIGESGYGIRDKDGTLEFKNSGGSWQSIQAILWELCGGPCGGGGGGGGSASLTMTTRTSSNSGQFCNVACPADYSTTGCSALCNGSSAGGSYFDGTSCQGSCQYSGYCQIQAFCAKVSN